MDILSLHECGPHYGLNKMTDTVAENFSIFYEDYCMLIDYISLFNENHYILIHISLTFAGGE